MKVVDCKQGTVEWYMARRGLPTASQFNRIITPKTGKASSSQLPLICELIADMAMNGAPMGVESYTSRAMQAGIDTEPDARRWYDFETGETVEQVGFCLSDCGRYGASPDGLVGDDGGLELKCPEPRKHIEYLIAGTLPAEYRCQVHGALIVTGRAWWDFMSYATGIQPLIVRVVPDEFTMQLMYAVHDFCETYDKWKQDARFADLFKKPEPPTAEQEQAAVDDLF